MEHCDLGDEFGAVTENDLSNEISNKDVIERTTNNNEKRSDLFEWSSLS